MQIFFGRLVTWIIGSTLTIWTAYKSFFLVTFIAFFMVGLYSLFLYGVQDILETVLTKLSSVQMPGSTPSIGGFSGLAGWFLVTLKVPEMLAFIIDIILLKWALRKIPFIKW